MVTTGIFSQQISFEQNDFYKISLDVQKIDTHLNINFL